MILRWLSLMIVLASAPIAAAQESKSPRKDPGPISAAVPPPAAPDVYDDERPYVVQVKLLEGKQLFEKEPDAFRLQTEIFAAAGNNLKFKPGVGLAGTFALDTLRITGTAGQVMIDQGQDGVTGILWIDVASQKTTLSAQELADEVIWNNNLADHPEIKVLSAPTLSTDAGQAVTIFVSGSQIFTYLVPAAGGWFQSRHTPPQELGMKLSLTVRPIEKDQETVELSPLEFRISAVDGREPVAGLDLDVGQPIVSTRSFKSGFAVKLGAVSILGIPGGKHQAALLLRVKQRPEDAALLRRVMLDITGRLPTPEETRAFLADKSADKVPKLIEKLLGDPERLTDEQLLRQLMPSDQQREAFLKDTDPNRQRKLIERAMLRFLRTHAGWSLRDLESRIGPAALGHPKQSAQPSP